MRHVLSNGHGDECIVRLTISPIELICKRFSLQSHAVVQCGIFVLCMIQYGISFLRLNRRIFCRSQLLNMHSGHRPCIGDLRPSSALQMLAFCTE
jgi:hypothetical protein